MSNEKTTKTTEETGGDFAPVQFTGESGSPVFMDPDAVTHIHKVHNKTTIGTVGGLVVEVTEAIEDVAEALGWI